MGSDFRRSTHPIECTRSGSLIRAPPFGRVRKLPVGKSSRIWSEKFRRLTGRAVVWDCARRVGVGLGDIDGRTALMGSRRAVITSSPPSRRTSTHVLLQSALCACGASINESKSAREVLARTNRCGFIARTTLHQSSRIVAVPQSSDWAILRG